MNSWKVILATIVIYGAGVVTGGLLVNHVHHSYLRNPRRMEAAPSTNSVSPTNGQNQAASKPPRQPEILNRQFLQRLDAELHLTPDQHEAIQKIITDGQNLMRKTMLDARLEIREQLTPDQRSQFDELVKRPPRRMPSSTNAPPVLQPTNAPAADSTNAPGA